MTARRGPAAWASATLGLAVAMMLPALVAIPAAGVAQPVTAQAVAVDVSTTTTPLTNLAHLDFLGDTVSPPEQAGHTTYRLADSPKLGVLWTYANLGADGVYERVGGGAYAAATNTWGQGAFNADDLSRAAVVYLRHWQLTGNGVSREHAYQLLRALTYMQTATGDNAGNVVLWMQPDGTLNPSAEPVELPDPSDSWESYWVGQLDRFGARVERAVRLHPEDDVAGVVAGCCLHVGERAQQLVRVLAADAVPGELPVAQVDHGRPAQVVRVEGPLAPGVGGGAYAAATNTWGQGAFNADDLSRAAVVYLRHWQLTGNGVSREHAYQLLRALTYMQTATGDNAGNVVLWMQPDGTLNPSADPVELPDPSDSAESYWVARTVWALGEGYAAFADVDAEFAAFLADRLDLALTGLGRDSLSRYGQWDVADGTRVPAWLIVDGADATAEAVIGLAAYVEAAPASPRAAHARTVLTQYAEGVAAMSGGDATSWPYGAILPWTHSPSMWHGWGSQMAAALARASQAVGRPALLRAAVKDAAVFTPYLLTATGPINGWLPTPLDLTQIAYGVDSRVQSLVAVADATDRPGFDQLAGIAASWYFGANRAGTPMYDPATGRTFDGLNADDTVNHNSGAESTIHGLLSMLALDARPGPPEW